MRRVKVCELAIYVLNLVRGPLPALRCGVNKGGKGERERKSIGRDLDPRGATSDVVARAVAGEYA
jgi:hypothetical protein